MSKFSSITVLAGTAKEVQDQASQYGMLVYATADAMVRRWKSSTDEERLAAIKTPTADTEPSALSNTDASDPRRESIKLSCRAARLVDKVDRALANDNDIDTDELRELVEELKGIQHGAERVAQASKKSAKRKGRAA